MPYERDLSLTSIKYADKHFKQCPFCQSNVPDWSVDISSVSTRIKYSFMCRACEGVIDIEAYSDDEFARGEFDRITLGNVGKGQYNYRKRGQDITLDELKEMCKDDSADEVEEEIVEESSSSGYSDITRSSSSSSSDSAFGIGLGAGATRTRSSGDITRTSTRSTSSSSDSRSDISARRVSSSGSTRTTSSSSTRTATAASYSSSSSSTARRTTSSGYSSSSSRSYSKPNRPFGFIALACGLLSFIIAGIFTVNSITKNLANFQNYFYAIVMIAVLGIVVSIIGTKKSRNRGSSVTGRVFSIFALVLSFITLILTSMIH